MHVKICGLTNLDDALAAVEAGADYLGFNFYPPSPRCLAPADCARIVSALPPGVVTVGIFVDEPPEGVRSLLDDCGLDLAQLHGAESPEVLKAMDGQAFKAFRGAGHRHASYARVGPAAPAFLIDAVSPAYYGGTGQTADWAAARQVSARYPIFLAGGLTPGNVASAVARVRPWGVDVASGVERAPGRKDHAKVRAFIAAAKENVRLQTPDRQ